jgi:hypothetical protein
MPIEFFSAHPTVPILVIGTVVAVVSLRSQRYLARAKNTLDFDKDFKEKELRTLQAAHALIRTTGPGELAELGGLEIPDEAFRAIARALNVWEGVAIGVRNGVYSERLLRDGYGSTVVWMYRHAQPFIEQRQRNNPHYYSNFCWLGARWAASRAFCDLPKGTSHRQSPADGNAAPGTTQRILRLPIHEGVTRHANRP